MSDIIIVPEPTRITNEYLLTIYDVMIDSGLTFYLGEQDLDFYVAESGVVGGTVGNREDMLIKDTEISSGHVERSFYRDDLTTRTHWFMRHRHVHFTFRAELKENGEIHSYSGKCSRDCSIQTHERLVLRDLDAPFLRYEVAYLELTWKVMERLQKAMEKFYHPNDIKLIFMDEEENTMFEFTATEKKPAINFRKLKLRGPDEDADFQE